MVLFDKINKEDFRFVVLKSEKDSYVYEKGYFKNGKLNGWGERVWIHFYQEGDKTHVVLEYGRGSFVDGKLEGIGLSACYDCYKEGKYTLEDQIPWEDYIEHKEGDVRIGFFKKSIRCFDDIYEAGAFETEEVLVEIHFRDYDMIKTQYNSGFTKFVNEDGDIKLFNYLDADSRWHGLSFVDIQGKVETKACRVNEHPELEQLEGDPSLLSKDELKLLLG